MSERERERERERHTSAETKGESNAAALKARKFFLDMYIIDVWIRRLLDFDFGFGFRFRLAFGDL